MSESPNQKLEETFRRLFGKVEDLPTLPDIVARISKMTVSPQTNAADIGKLIGNDPALSSKVLRLVNSAYYGFPRKISSVTKAIVLLGFAKVKNMAISAAVVDVFSDTGDVDQFNFLQYWQHAVAAGICSELLTRRFHPAKADDAFVAGLLSETGKVLMAHCAPDRYSEVLTAAGERDIPVVEAEEEVLGLTHMQAGAMLADSWNFPELLVETIRSFRNPGAVREHRDVIDAVHVANVVVSALGFPGAGERRVPQVNPGSYRNLKLDADTLYSLEIDFLRAYEKAGALLELAV